MLIEPVNPFFYGFERFCAKSPQIQNSAKIMNISFFPFKGNREAFVICLLVQVGEMAHVKAAWQKRIMNSL